MNLMNLLLTTPEPTRSVLQSPLSTPVPVSYPLSTPEALFCPTLPPPNVVGLMEMTVGAGVDESVIWLLVAAIGLLVIGMVVNEVWKRRER